MCVFSQYTFAYHVLYSRDLELDPMTLIYEVCLDIRKDTPACKTRSFYVNAFNVRDRRGQADTDETERINIAAFANVSI